MQVPQHFDASLTSSATTTISVMQGDGLRLLVAQLKKDTEPWPVPVGISAGLSYELPDQAPGYYDRLNDGTPACVINGDQVSVILEPILTEQPGPVKASIILRDPDGIQIATFPFHILVEQVPGMVHGKNLQAPAHAFNEKIYYGGVGGILQPLGLGRGMQAEKQKDGSLLLVAEGNTPVRGVDYWTPADQEAIVQQVIAALGTPVFGRVDRENNIILTGELADGTYTLKYEDGKGNVTEIGDIIIGEAGRPIGVNMIPLSVNADGTPFVGTNGEAGYKSGWRLNSSGGETAQENLYCTGFMPVETGDTISLHNVGWSVNQSDNYRCFIVLYDEQFQKVGYTTADQFKSATPEIEGVVSGGRFRRYDVGDGATSYTHLVGFQIAASGAKYLRLSAYYLSATSSVMVAES